MPTTWTSFTHGRNGASGWTKRNPHASCLSWEVINVKSENQEKEETSLTSIQSYYWAMKKNNKLSLANKLLIYKVVIKPIWSRGIQIWDSMGNSSLEILERFQPKVLRSLLGAPWFEPKAVIRCDLKIDTVKQETVMLARRYANRLEYHPNLLSKDLLTECQDQRRLRVIAHSGRKRFSTQVGSMKPASNPFRPMFAQCLHQGSLQANWGTLKRIVCYETIFMSYVFFRFYLLTVPLMFHFM